MTKRVSKIRTQGSRMRSVNTTSEQSRLSKPKKSLSASKLISSKMSQIFLPEKKVSKHFRIRKKTKRTPPKFKGTKKSEFFSPELLFRDKKKLAKVLRLGNVYFLKTVMIEALLCHSNQPLLCATAIQQCYSC